MDAILGALRVGGTEDQKGTRTKDFLKVCRAARLRGRVRRYGATVLTVADQDFGCEG